MTLAKIRSESQAQECRCVVRRLSLPRRSKTVRQLVAQHPLRLRQHLPPSLNRPSPLRQKQTSCTVNLQNPRFGAALWSLMLIPSEIGRKAAETLRRDLESSRAEFGIGPWDSNCASAPISANMTSLQNKFDKRAKHGARGRRHRSPEE